MSTLVELIDLKRYFDTPGGKLHAVDGVNMKFEQGETMGVVGESGCGKSTLSRTIIHLQEPTDGKIIYNGKDITSPTKRELSELRREMQIIFQDPYMTLNPRYTVDDTLREPMEHSGRYSKEQIDREVIRLMDMVGISKKLRMTYPHELSGGRRQRVGIGRALAMNPKFIVCDEPVSALDVSVQAQIINLLQDLQKEMGLTYMFVTHDMSVVRHISHKISVMYLGQLVEVSEAKELFNITLHPYSSALLSSIPTIAGRRSRDAFEMKGELVSPINPRPGCRFAPRCPYVSEACGQPQILEELLPGHFVACCRARELNKDVLAKASAAEGR